MYTRQTSSRLGRYERQKFGGLGWSLVDLVDPFRARLAHLFSDPEKDLKEAQAAYNKAKTAHNQCSPGVGSDCPRLLREVWAAEARIKSAKEAVSKDKGMKTNDQIADIFIKYYGNWGKGWETYLTKEENAKFVDALASEGQLISLEQLVLRWGRAPLSPNEKHRANQLIGNIEGRIPKIPSRKLRIFYQKKVNKVKSRIKSMTLEQRRKGEKTLRDDIGARQAIVNAENKCIKGGGSWEASTKKCRPADDCSSMDWLSDPMRCAKPHLTKLAWGAGALVLLIVAVYGVSSGAGRGLVSRVGSRKK